METVERLNDNKASSGKTTFLEIDKRNPAKRKVNIRESTANLYGQRPKHENVWHLSPYEFTMYWQPVLAKYPLTLDMLEMEDPSAFHVSLTPKGEKKLRDGVSELLPRVDYVVKDGGVDWLPFPDCPSTRHFRHLGIGAKSAA